MATRGIKYISQVSLVLLAFFAMNTVDGQNLVDDLKKMKDAYEKSSKLKMKIVSKEYEGENSKPTIEETLILRDGNDLRYLSKERILMMNDAYVVVVDERSKLIRCIPRENKEMKKPDDMGFMAQTGINFDTLISSYDKVEYLGVKNGNKVYRMTLKDQDITTIEMGIDAQSYLMKQIRYTYNEEWYGKTWINISMPLIDTNPSFEKDTFSEWSFLKKEQGELKPNDRYKDYRLVVIQ